MSRNLPLFDREGNLITAVFHRQARNICTSRNAVEKGQGLEGLGSYFKYLRQLKDPSDPAFMVFLRSGLFEEVVEILTTPVDPDKKGRLALYQIALLTLNDIVRSAWIHEPYAKGYLEASGPIMLEVHHSVHQLPALKSEDIRFKIRDLFLGIFEVLLKIFASAGPSFQDSLEVELLVELVFDYYFGLASPIPGEYSASGARAVLFHLSQEAFLPGPRPYLKKVLAQHGEKYVVSRFTELAKKTGKGQILNSESSWNLLAHFLSVRPLQKRLLKELKLHVFAMRSFWKEPYFPHGNPYLSSEMIAHQILFLIASILPLVEPPLRLTLVNDLVQNDLILLFGRALFGPRAAAWLQQVPQICSPSGIYGHLRLHAHPDIAKSQWIHVWKSLNSARRSAKGDPQSVSWPAFLEFWYDFGHDALDLPLDSEWVGLPVDAGKLSACDWIKCPCFGSVCQDWQWWIGSPPSHCTGCYKVNYCSLACQKLDWTEGNHRQICKSRFVSDSKST